MTELNGKRFLVAGVTTNTFQLTDKDGTNINSTSFTTYGSAGTWAASTNTTSPLEMGSTDSAAYFSGNIDELAIFGSVKTGAEISSIYNSGTPTDLSGESNLVGYWRNGDTDGTSVYPTIEDYGPFGNDGTMTNMVSGDIVTVVP